MSRPTALIAGIALAALGLAAFSLSPEPPPAPLEARATAALDPLRTGSIPPEARPDPAPEADEDTFAAALALIAEGEISSAYEAAGLLDPIGRLALRWAIVHHHAAALAPETIARFMADSPGLVPDTTLRARIEASFVAADADPDAVRAFFADIPPQTLDGSIAFASALAAAGETGRAAELGRAIWVDNFLSVEQEARALAGFGALLAAEDHWARAERLMLHDRIQAAERLTEHFSPAQLSLLVARAATARRQDDGKALLDAVDESLHGHPVFIFTRAQRARLAGLSEQALDWLDRAPETPPEPALWWEERRLLTRSFLAEGRADLAYRAAAGFSEGPAAPLVTAQFHAGWIALSFLGDAAAARGYFIAMAGAASQPDTIAQAQYWLARAERALDAPAAAEAALARAGEFPTVFYGQLARAELGLADVPLQPLPDRADALAFAAAPAVAAIRRLAEAGEPLLAGALLRQWAGGLDADGELILAAELAEEIGAHNVAIAIAEIGRERGVPLDPFGFPLSGLPEDATLAAAPAAVLAITRQESLFQPGAISSAGARGLMQLMPGTAEDTARKLGLAYSRERLTSDPAYNVLLGSTYLSEQLTRYDRSLLLAAAAYNAGPGNANRWIAAYGDPRAENVDPVIWIELIPFTETRRYVQRVLGNYLTYRARLGEAPLVMTEALRRIP